MPDGVWIIFILLGVVLGVTGGIFGVFILTKRNTNV